MDQQPKSKDPFNKIDPDYRYFKIIHKARVSNLPEIKSMPLIQPSSKKIRKGALFNINSKFFHQLVTKRVESLSPVAIERESVKEVVKQLYLVFEKMDEDRIYYPEYLLSFIYSILKLPNKFSCDYIEDLPLFQKNIRLPDTHSYNEVIKDFENQWLDVKINKNFENNTRELSITSQKTFINLARIVKIDPKRLEQYFFQCNGNLANFMDFLKIKDKKLLWNEIEDTVIRTGKEKNALAYELLQFYKGNDKKLIERENFLKKMGKF